MVSAEQSSLRPKPPVSKVRLAVLDESTVAQLRDSLSVDGDLELTWAGTSLEKLQHDQPKAQVLLANINYLGDEPAERMNELVEMTGAELGIALYAFAKRSVLDSISSKRVRALRAPLNMPMLRCQMMGLIARNLLSGNANSGARKATIRAPRYSQTQLGKLQQISTAIDCECPNQIAVLLQGLADFEAYSKGCENRDDEDARIHRMLYEHTARARALMDDAMAQLLEHERIQLD